MSIVRFGEKKTLKERAKTTEQNEMVKDKGQWQRRKKKQNFK